MGFTKPPKLKTKTFRWDHHLNTSFGKILPHTHIIDWSGGSLKFGPPVSYPNGAPDVPLQMLISQICMDDPASTEKWCDSADKVLEYVVGEDQRYGMRLHRSLFGTAQSDRFPAASI